MRLLMIAAAAAMLSLSACAAADVTQPIGSTSQSAQDAMNAAKKGLTAAHSLHQAAADALTAAAEIGALQGANAATAKTWLDKSKSLLTAADALVQVGDAAGIEAKVSAATELIAQVQGLVSGTS